MKHAGNRTGRDAKRRRRRHERRMARSFERSGHTTSAALVDWPPLTFEGLQESIDALERLATVDRERLFCGYGLSITIPTMARILIDPV